MMDCSYGKPDKIIIADVNDKKHGCFDLVIDSSGANSELRKYAKKTSCVEQLQYGSLYANLKLPEESAYNIDALTVYSGKDHQGVGIMPTGYFEVEKNKTVSMFFNLNLEDSSHINKVKAFSTSDKIDKAIQSYAKTRKHHVRFYQTLAKFIAPFYQSDSQYAIEIRNTLFGFFTNMYIFKYLSTYLLPGHIGHSDKKELINLKN